MISEKRSCSSRSFSAVCKPKKMKYSPYCMTSRGFPCSNSRATARLPCAREKCIGNAKTVRVIQLRRPRLVPIRSPARSATRRSSTAVASRDTFERTRSRGHTLATTAERSFVLDRDSKSTCELTPMRGLFRALTAGIHFERDPILWRMSESTREFRRGCVTRVERFSRGVYI